MIVSNDEPAEVAQPGEGAFDLPTVPVSPQFSSVLCRRFDADAAVRTDQVDAAVPEPARASIIILLDYLLTWGNMTGKVGGVGETSS